MNAEISKRLPILKYAARTVVDEFEKNALLKKFSADEIIALEGSDTPYFFVVLSGIIRVYKIGESGREITLYRVGENESCVLTAFSILSRTKLPAFAVAEKPVEMVLISAPVLREWIHRHDVWREHMFNTLSIRIQEILYTLDKVTFQRVDIRIANYLLQHTSSDNGIIKITHEYLAREVGTTRVVVSRILEEFAREGMVELARGKITVNRRARLAEKIKNFTTG